uniref:Arylsulfatase n=1 Tax=Candidatus Kentrum sp. FW TaxID=2126338 RepID=A0A450RT31_9GAMM|nr:MAG: arylsulfatase [Candidatus Kentron sp. FW]
MLTVEEKLPYNILLITCDQLRYFRDDEWPEGFPLPNIKRLKAMGTSFDNHYICASACTPSRGSMYTGLHMPIHGVFENTILPMAQSRLPPQHKTLAHWLDRAGYHAVYKGKWHLEKEMEPPFKKKEFDSREEMKVRYGFHDYDGEVSSAGLPLSGYYHDETIAATTIGWLRRQGQELNDAGNPWFLAVNFVNPHDIMFYGDAERAGNHCLRTPHREPTHEIYRSRWSLEPNNWRQSLEGAGRPMAHRDYHDADSLIVGPMDNTLAEWRRYNDFYLNSIRLVDRQIGGLLHELDALGISDRTIILFTSDHGEMAGAHGLKGKGPMVYEEAIHVPMIIAHPGHTGGQRCRALTSHMDLAPTILGSTGMVSDLERQVARELPGYDMTTLLANSETGKLRDALLFTFNMLFFLDSDFIRSLSLNRQKGTPTTPPNIDKRGAIRMAFDGRYKFARYFAPSQHNTPETMEALLAHNDLELFDLERDIRETVNLGADPTANSELILGMNEKLNRLIEDEIGEDKGGMLSERENGRVWHV